MTDAVLARARRAARRFAATPLHPQWLLRRRRIDSAALAVGAGECVADVGCGNRWIEASLPEGARYVGLDHPVPGARYAARPDVLADASRLPLRDGCMSAVALVEVLEHVRDPERTLSEAARVLAPGGRLLLTMPFLYALHDAPHDYQRFTPFGLRRSVEAAGLTVQWIRPSLCGYEAAGLLSCLAIASGVAECIERRSLRVVLAIALLSLVPLINLAAWLVARALPGWAGMAVGHELLATRP